VKKLGIFIYARLSSARLPNKMLLKINRKPIIWYVYKRAFLIQNTNKNIFVLTSKSKLDDKIVEFCIQNKIQYFRGSLNNVLKRTIDCCKKNKLSFLMRICGDRPFHDFKLSRLMLKAKYENYDLVTNNFPKSFPKGQICEIVKLKVLENIYKKNISNLQKEHICNYIYENFKNFKIKNFKSKYSKDIRKLNLSIDTKKDFLKVSRCLKNFNYNTKITSNKIINYYKK
tara:strand:+ start:1023 stop:1706 length:684 start_codon:yes stop_codon:yes gene_type:complete